MPWESNLVCESRKTKRDQRHTDNLEFSVRAENSALFLGSFILLCPLLLEEPYVM